MWVSFLSLDDLLILCTQFTQSGRVHRGLVEFLDWSSVSRLSIPLFISLSVLLGLHLGPSLATLRVWLWALPPAPRRHRRQLPPLRSEASVSSSPSWVVWIRSCFFTERTLILYYLRLYEDSVVWSLHLPSFRNWCLPIATLLDCFPLLSI